MTRMLANPRTAASAGNTEGAQMETKHLPPWEHPLCEDPIHTWFSLSYANYLVIPRTLLQSCSKETQLAVCRALEMAYREEAEHMPHHWPHEAKIVVKLKDVASGKFVTDPLANYERGRRRLWEPRDAEQESREDYIATGTLNPCD